MPFSYAQMVTFFFDMAYFGAMNFDHFYFLFSVKIHDDSSNIGGKRIWTQDRDLDFHSCYRIDRNLFSLIKCILVIDKQLPAEQEQVLGKEDVFLWVFLRCQAVVSKYAKLFYLNFKTQYQNAFGSPKEYG